MFRQRDGFTFVEIAVVAAVVAILTAVLAPIMIKHLDTAKIHRAENDTEVIASSILAFELDTGHWPVYNATPYKRDKATIKILYSDGMAPGLAGGISGWWSGTWSDDTVNADVDHLENHMELGMAGSDSYPATGEHPWNGPYFAKVKKDPWDRKYLVNVEFLRPGENKAVWAISAGPNRVIDTPYQQQISGTGTAPTLGGDDIGARVK
jgi:prepilin-type N-terminal cleavage/methylation domain-containing protein